MQAVEFMTSYLTFYLKGKVEVEKNFVKFQIPNTILKLIPLGKATRSLPVNQISHVDDSFRVSIKSMIWGIIMLLLGLGALVNDPGYGIILSLYGILTILSSFETILVVNSTAGAPTIISFVVFEKSKALVCKDYINNLIAEHLDDNNLRANTREAMENANKNADRIVDAIKK